MNARQRLTRRGVTRLAAAALVAARLGTVRLTGVAAAKSVDDCQAKIASLRTATQGATFSGQNREKDQAGLVGKLDSASAKLAQGKDTDAVKALSDFRIKVETLQTQGKITSSDANALIAGVNDAIACIQALTATA
jgi:hypothetical protein